MIASSEALIRTPATSIAGIAYKLSLCHPLDKSDDQALKPEIAREVMADCDDDQDAGMIASAYLDLLALDGARSRATGGQTRGADQNLHDLGVELDLRWAQEQRVSARDATDEELNAACSHTCAIASRIRWTPAATLDGFRVKARMIEYMFDGDEGLITDTGTGGRFLDSLLRELRGEALKPHPSETENYASVRILRQMSAELVKPKHGAGIAAQAADAGSAADLYQRYLAARDSFNANCNDETELSEFKVVGDLRDATLDAPICCRADAAAKIKMAAASFTEGDLVSGKDVAALDQVARWLEGS